MRHQISLIVGLVILGLSPFNGATEEVLDSDPAGLLKRHLGLIHDLKALYSQRAADNAAMRQTGKFWLKQPGRFRLEPADDQNPVLVSDGRSLWEFDALLEQVIIHSASSDPTVSPVLLLARSDIDLETAYNIDLYRDELEEVFVLSPVREDAFFRNLSLHFKDGLPVGIRVLALSDQYLEMEIRILEYNGEVPLSLFHFEVPAGVDVIDYRS